MSEIFYPGELEALADVLNRADGIELPEDTAAELRGHAADLNVASPF